MGLYATFIGEQEDGEGGSFKLYNIIDPEGIHELHGSTVGEEKIKELSLEVR